MLQAAPAPPPSPSHAPGLREALPAEFLDSPVTGAPVFIERMEEWRLSQRWSKREFCARLGMSEVYYRKLRSGEKPLTQSVALRVIEERPELALVLGNYFTQKRRQRRRKPDAEGVPLEGD